MNPTVFRTAAIGTKDAIERLAGSYATELPERRLLDAVAARYAGDVNGMIQLLRRQIRKRPASEAAPFADLLAPILIMRRESVEVLRLADVLAEAGWQASAASFRALAAAEVSDRETARRYARETESLCADLDDDVMQLRIYQRLARIAYSLDEHDRALEFAYRSSSIAERIGEHTAAYGGYSIAFNINHDVLENFVEAGRYARLMQRAATESGDASMLQGSRVMEYTVAVQTGDAERIEALHEAVRKQLLPEQYAERYPLALAHAMAIGARDLQAMRSELQLIGKLPTHTRGQRALCSALEALADAARHDDDAARVRLRGAITELGRPMPKAPPHERRLRLLARATLAFTCALLGDHVRAARILATSEIAASPPMCALGAGADDVIDSVRGMQRIFAHARSARLAFTLPSNLTHAEIEVLKLLNHGWSAGRIARETDRSVNTVYNHTRAILGKLGASRAAEAVAIARQQGILS